MCSAFSRVRELQTNSQTKLLEKSSCNLQVQGFVWKHCISSTSTELFTTTPKKIYKWKHVPGLLAMAATWKPNSHCQKPRVTVAPFKTDTSSHKEQLLGGARCSVIGIMMNSHTVYVHFNQRTNKYQFSCR